MSSQRRVSLSPEQWRYLTTVGYLSDMLRECVNQAEATPDGRAVLDVDPELAEDFRSALTERLAATGFDEAYEPNEEGEQLEALIDAFHA